jgi:Rha family phage regulatory protein
MMLSLTSVVCGFSFLGILIMNQLVTSSMVQVLGGEIKTTSLQVAEFFGKNHKDVLKAIKNLECSDGFIGRNFALIRNDVALREGVSREDVAYEITRDGFAFLGMGFTGKEAAAFKEAYINAFNTMETALIKQRVMDAIMGKVSERTKLGIWVRQGLSQEQWAKLDESMRDIADGCDKSYNAIHSHFMRYFKGSDIPFEMAEMYLRRVRAAYNSGYEPEYKGGKVIMDEDFI